MRKPSFLDLLPEHLSRRDPSALLAIDGRCGGGKTSLAGELHRRYGWSVVPMDDFFLRPKQRTAARLAQAGGNVDYERFLEEVLLPLRSGGDISYRPFDCAAMTLAAPVSVRRTPVVVVEGSYACHPALWEAYDLRLFVDISPERQWERILRREGPQKAETFRSRWIPLEEAYFAAFSVRERCDWVVQWPETERVETL